MRSANHPAAHGTGHRAEHGDDRGIAKSESLTEWLELTRDWPQFLRPDRTMGGPDSPVEDKYMHASAAKPNSVLVACPECHTLVRVPEERLADNPACARCKSSVVSGSPVTLDAQSFETHTTRSGLPVLVDFWAPWCGPCRMMAPVLDRVADQRRTQIQVGKLNTDENQELAGRLGIRSIPTLILYRDGQELARRSGASDLNSLTRWLDESLSR
jgi:thioredoxin 2